MTASCVTSGITLIGNGDLNNISAPSTEQAELKRVQSVIACGTKHNLLISGGIFSGAFEKYAIPPY